MQILWVTDPHLNFARHDVWEAWVNSMQLIAGNRLVITGDITEADDLEWQLMRLQETLSIPISFVLGNHDFYGSRVSKVRAAMGDLVRRHSGLEYLTNGVVVPLEDQWCLVGNDGWADAGHGDALHSPVRLNDFRRIADFGGFDLKADLEVMKRLAVDSAEAMRRSLELACLSFQRIIIATHIPPFREACWYEGRLTDDDWAPYFTSRVMGDVLLDFAVHYPGHHFHVLCGHTHHPGVARLAPNLTVWTGRADYGRPAIQDLIDTEQLMDRLQD